MNAHKAAWIGANKHRPVAQRADSRLTQKDILDKEEAALMLEDLGPNKEDVDAPTHGENKGKDTLEVGKHGCGSQGIFEDSNARPHHWNNLLLLYVTKLHMTNIVRRLLNLWRYCFRWAYPHDVHELGSLVIRKSSKWKVHSGLG